MYINWRNRGGGGGLLPSWEISELGHLRVGRQSPCWDISELVPVRGNAYDTVRQLRGIFFSLMYSW